VAGVSRDRISHLAWRLDPQHELRPGDDAQTHDYYFTIPVEWARRWPGEDLWEAHLR
jgi:hypothetical protein